MKTEQTTIVALLHDVVEDTDYTLEDLSKMGFEAAVVEALDSLTHDDETKYMDHLRPLRITLLQKRRK